MVITFEDEPVQGLSIRKSDDTEGTVYRGNLTNGDLKDRAVYAALNTAIAILLNEKPETAGLIIDTRPAEPISIPRILDVGVALKNPEISPYIKKLIKVVLVVSSEESLAQSGLKWFISTASVLTHTTIEFATTLEEAHGKFLGKKNK